MLRSVFSVLSSTFAPEASAKGSGKGSEGREESSKEWQKICGSPSHITEISRGSDVELGEARLVAQGANEINVHTSLRSEVGRA